MRIYKGLTFFSVFVFAAKGMMTENASGLTLSKPSQASSKNFLEPLMVGSKEVETTDLTLINLEKVGVSEEMILKKLENIMNTTSLASLEDTIEDAKQLNRTQLNDLVKILTPPLKQYLNGRRLNIRQALDAGYLYMKASNLTTFQALMETVNLDTKLMVTQVLDKLAQRKQTNAVVPLLIVVLATACCCWLYYRWDRNNDHDFAERFSRGYHPSLM